MPNILIADDNEQICSILSEYAKREGYTTYLAHDGEKTLKVFNAETFDIILLDVMMPKKDGFEVCKEIRQASNVPIIMVTARGEDFERIMGLDIGADDYIVKPFSPGEVMARVRAILRRIGTSDEPSKSTSIHSNKNSNTFTYDDLTINLEDFSVKIGEHVVTLTKKEFEILWVLATNQNKVFSRDNLLDSVWGYDYFGDNRTVDSHIKRLRAKLDEYQHPTWSVKTIWGVGYKFEEADHA